MALDPYKMCPCGSGKKVKFCCSKDIAQELSHVQRMLDGDQPQAAFDRIKKLLKEKGEDLKEKEDRACLLVLHASIAMQLDQLDEAKASVGKLVVSHPENPVALAQSALIEVAEGKILDSVTALQRALEHSGKQIAVVVWEALGVVGAALAASGEVMAAKSHCLMHTALAQNQEDARVAIEMLMRIQSSPEVPLLLKQDWKFEDCPTGVEWEQPFNEAMNRSGSGVWLATVEKLEKLAQQYPGQKAILRNIAVLRNSLGDSEEIVAAWRRYAMLDDVEMQDAVEAEMLAQLIDPDSNSGTIDLMEVVYPVNDQERVSEMLTASRRLSLMPYDMSTLAEEGQPPPKAAYWLLDRDEPATGVDLKREDVPMVLGELFFFGRQTDRSARVEFSTEKTEDYDDKKAALTGVLGEFLGEPEDEKSVDQLSALSHAMTWNWRFPTDTPAEVRAKLLDEQQKDLLLNRWPTMSLGVLGRKSPQEVANDPGYKIKVLAAIGLLELSNDNRSHSSMDFNELRQQLNLPLREAIDPTDADVDRLPVVRLPWVEVEKLTDQQLLECFSRANRCLAKQAVKKLSFEIIRRESLEDVGAKFNALQNLSHLAEDHDEALGYFQQAKDLAVSNGQPEGQLLIAELRLRFERGIIDGCQALVQRIASKHMKEPGIAGALHALLSEYGLIGPDGRPAGAPQAQPAGAPAAEEAGKIWTPGSETPEPAAEGGSKLWVPGMGLIARPPIA